MKTKILYILLGLFLVGSSLILMSSQQEQPGPMVIRKASTNSSITKGVVYTKAQMISLFGQPDRYNEWESSCDEGIGFELKYGDNLFYFYPTLGFESFVLSSNDFYIENVNVRIGDSYNDFMAIYGQMIEVESSTPERIILKFWPWSKNADSYLSIAFKKSNGIFKVSGISYWPPV